MYMYIYIYCFIPVVILTARLLASYSLYIVIVARIFQFPFPLRRGNTLNRVNRTAEHDTVQKAKSTEPEFETEK